MKNKLKFFTGLTLFLASPLTSHYLTIEWPKDPGNVSFLSGLCGVIGGGILFFGYVDGHFWEE